MSMKILHKMSIVCTVGLVMVLLFSVPAFAGLGKIAGKITDAKTGDPLPGAQVQIVGTAIEKARLPVLSLGTRGC